ncbi:SDR family NAD(P)-dependent oxidoreductase [Novosphingobium malaysiense]|uniref:3-hydroxy-2-methylbutyryl-CoA dehydrogenase n=1 Tax=Novosphingobium malaysiense TaxID=1348853 RepID=A0A0B1ZI73_9SPHN|nr:SDR family NAD(P)-dependent oxidoreductase [Novosphingobium malaysiense]KHK88983.1 3-hydroxy-2-methylbutyryl-CoA dehydrogenase [Novosphingobium malaysiense]
MDISGGSVLVTGGAGGFGSAAARRLGGLGAKVVVADVADERGEALASEIGNGAQYVRTDIMSEDSIVNAVEAACRLAPLRAAIIAHGGPLPDDPGGRTIRKDGSRVSVAHFAHYLSVYLTSAYCVSSVAAEAMAKNEPLRSNQRGVIVNTASIAGFEGQPGQVPYGAAKGGIISMALNLARDLAPLGIRSMAIAPGTFLTYAFAQMGNEAAQERFGPLVLNPKRMGDPDEYGMLAQQIVENDFLNATTIRLDGGQRF